MKFSSQFYAKALIHLIKNKKPEEVDAFIGKALEIIRKNGDMPQKKKILEFVEKYVREMEGKELLEIVSSSSLPSDVLAKIQEEFSSEKFEIKEKISKEILAGAKLILNKNKELDVSFKNLIDNLLNNKKNEL